MGEEKRMHYLLQNNDRPNIEGLYDHQVLARALRTLNSTSGLFLLHYKARSGRKEAARQSASCDSDRQIQRT